jgi:hypothetical protein
MIRWIRWILYNSVPIVDPSLVIKEGTRAIGAVLAGVPVILDARDCTLGCREELPTRNEAMHEMH